MEQVDYTKWRKGKRTGRGSRKIDVCPKCGRKGEYTPSYTTPKGKVWPAEFTHTGEIDDIFGFFLVREHCTIKKERNNGTD